MSNEITHMIAIHEGDYEEKDIFSGAIRKRIAKIAADIGQEEFIDSDMLKTVMTVSFAPKGTLMMISGQFKAWDIERAFDFSRMVSHELRAMVIHTAYWHETETGQTCLFQNGIFCCTPAEFSRTSWPPIASYRKPKD